MAKYKVSFKKSVIKDMRSIPKKDVAKIMERINSLSAEPRPSNCQKLSGQERYRVRQGVYRIIYEIFDNTLLITIVKIGHRNNVYRSNH